jgi:hypothetical protein
MRLRDAWGRFVRWLIKEEQPWTTTQVEELPDELKARTVYVLGEGRHVWSVAMVCPCGCGDTIHLNTLAGTRPRWRMRRHRDESITLHPSVWRNTGCRSHFFLRAGHIMWCRGLGEGDLAGRADRRSASANRRRRGRAR